MPDRKIRMDETLAERAWRMLARIRPAYLVIIAVAILAQAILVSIGSFEVIYNFSRAHESWELDEFFTVFIVATFALLAILAVRANTLRKEVHRRVSAEAEAERLARHDPLTGLGNRRLLYEEFAHRLGGHRASNSRQALFLLDLDRFKAVNDTYGHTAGDRLLQSAADRLSTLLRPQDFLARLGGDEFAILISDVDNEEIIFRIAQRILNAVAEPIFDETFHATVTVSIGIAVYPSDGDTVELLMQRADAAMYQAKSGGRNTYAMFNTTLDQMMRERFAMETALREAIAQGDIFPHYQPLIDLATKRIVSFEALARWRHPKLGVLDASKFVPIAEDAGLIGDIFSAVLRQACLDGRHWDSSLTIAVNVSPSQFRDPRLADKVLQVLLDTGFPPERLEIEITENALVVDIEATRQTIDALKAKGVRVALDDFGTGYSSLRHLHELPFDKVKIDQSFVHKLGTDEESQKITASIIGLGRALGLVTVAEGIETDLEADWIWEHGGKLGQGFLFSRPVEAKDIPALIAAQREHRPGSVGHAQDSSAA